MKRAIVFFVLVFASAFGQGTRQVVPDNPNGTIKPAPQPAQDITIHLSAEVATAVEALRINMRGVPVTSADGTTSVAPVYPNIAALIDAALKARGGFFQNALQRYPTDAIKAKIAAAEAAAKDRDDALTPSDSGARVK